MAMTQATAQAHLDAWIAADLAVASGQAYSIGGRSLTRASAEEIRSQMTYWRRTIERFAAVAAGNTGNASVVYPKWA